MRYMTDTVSLAWLAPGERGKIIYLDDGGSQAKKLLSLGIVPGRVLILKRKTPNYLVQVGFTQIALEQSIGNIIFVRRSSR